MKNAPRYLARFGTSALLLGALCSLGFSQSSGLVKGRLLVKFTPGTSAAREAALVAKTGGQEVGEISRIGVKVLALPARSNEVAVAEGLSHDPSVNFAEPDFVRAPDSIPNDPMLGQEWHLTKIAAPSAWNVSLGSSSIIIAILDTGCDPTHPDLSPMYVPGWNMYDNNSDTHDVYGHGTPVAGVAAADTNDSIGVAGVAWNCRIMPIRISDPSGNAAASTIANGLTWAADHGAKVANISYSFNNNSTVTSAAQYFQSKGGVVTMSAGNSGTFDSSPDNKYLLTVSATDSNDLITSWSTTGNDVDVSAPGQTIYSTGMGGGYGAGTGTSFSAPIVAGVAALVMSANPALTGAQVQSVIRQSTDDLGPAGWDAQYGTGRVNASKAMSLAIQTGGSADTTAPNVSFASPSNGGAVAGSVSAQVNASDNVAVGSVTLYVDGAAYATLSTAPYYFNWNTSALANGAHNLRADAMDSSGNVSSTQISVTVNNVADTTAPTATITSPAAGSHVGNSFTVTATASDNIGVTRVELWVDGALIATDTSNPYSFNYNSRKWATGATHTLQVKAYDAAGNVGLSSIVSVTK